MYGSNEWRTKVHCVICWLVEDTYVPVVQKLAEILPEASIAALTVLKCLTFPQYTTVPALTLGAESLPKGAQIETQIIAHSGTYTIVDDGEAETRKCTPCFISGMYVCKNYVTFIKLRPVPRSVKRRRILGILGNFNFRRRWSI